MKHVFIINPMAGPQDSHLLVEEEVKKLNIDYVIYITTTSNITDIAELTEKLGRNLDSVTATINNKNYSFSINNQKGNRIELTVK